ncbi:hypothetical protein ACGFIF_02240 [Kribbella sp. NPDC049174]|uniref:hypothetical protein n=1 Tax=Kribbella sp. NPDC049174 TaxID=3364112 RepID=UPI0037112C35
MSGPPLDLRRRTRHPAAGLFRATAVVAALTLPLVWVLTAWAPFGPVRCGRELGSDGIPVPCPDSIRPYDALFRAILATGAAELVAIGIYLVVALPRSTAPASAVLRQLPLSAGVIALALGPYAVATEGTGLLTPLFLLWILAPLIVYGVHRADARSAVIVLLALLPSGVVSAILVLDEIYHGMPAAMFLATGVLVGVRRATS